MSTDGGEKVSTENRKNTRFVDSAIVKTAGMNCHMEN
jgi:hypothetical protein